MRVSNATIAQFFFRLANLLEIAGDSSFKVRAYRNAAQTVLDYPHRLDEMVCAGEDLTAIPEVGPAIAGKIEGIVRDKSFPLYDETRARLPETLLELLHVRGLGPARVRALREKLGIATVEELRNALEEGRLPQVKGFTDRTVDRIRRSLYEYMAQRGRVLRAHAEQTAEDLLRHLASHEAVLDLAITGSFRRGCESVGDLDVVIATRSPQVTHAALRDWDHALGDTPTDHGNRRVATDVDLDVHLIAVPPEQFGAALLRTTGSTAWVAAVERVAADQGFTFDGLSIRRGEEPVEVPTEEALFALLGLAPMAPELREDPTLSPPTATPPDLVVEADIRGDLHMHTTFTDGRHSIEEMAQVARARGYEYIAITDHTRNVKIAGGLEPQDVPAYLEAIEQVDARTPGITLLKGLEVDILADGTMDMPDEIMLCLDVVIAAIHSYFDQPLETMTARVLAALHHPLVQILAHPSGRLIGQRSPLLLDFDQLFATAAGTGTCLELNANPERLDLHAEHCRVARSLGIPVVISTDAHATWQLENMPRGLRQGRRGHLTPADVLNTLPLDALRQRLLRKRHGHGAGP